MKYIINNMRIKNNIRFKKASISSITCSLTIIFMSFLLLNCEDKSQSIDNRARQQALQQRENRESLRRTDGGQGTYYGSYKASSYSGEKCKDLDSSSTSYEDCEKICRKVYGRLSDDCEGLPVSLIRVLNSLFDNMSHIRDGEDQLTRRINTFDFGVMIDINIEPVIKLIRSWSIREVKEFLIWTAKNSAVSLAIMDHDEDNQILYRAFRKLGEGYASTDSKRIEYGLSTDLQGFGSTFLIIAESLTDKNLSAFVIVHKLLKRVCFGNFSKNCKLRFYCKRKEFSRSTSRGQQCHYSSDRRSSFRTTYCYQQGPSVWSYWNKLNEDGEFDDDDFSPKDVINEVECDKLCQSEACAL